LEKCELHTSDPKPLGSKECCRLPYLWRDTLSNNDNALILIKGYGFVRFQLEILSVMLGKAERFVIQIRPENSFKLIGVQLLSKRCVFNTLGNRIARRSVSFQLDYHDIAFAVKAKKINESPEVGNDLPAYDQNATILDNTIRI